MDTFNILIANELIPNDIYCDKQVIEFVVKIYQNDTIYIMQNFDKIKQSVTYACQLVVFAFGDIKMIKFFVKKWRTINESINFKNDALFVAVQYNFDLDVIKYMIEELGVDINYVNIACTGVLMRACGFNNNLNIIKYLIETIHMGYHRYNNHGDNVFTYTCWQNCNLDIIKYLSQLYRMQYCSVDKYGNNAFLAACMNNVNIDILKYLADDLKINYKMINNVENNAFMYACKHGDITTVKYLAEELALNPYIVNKNGDTGFMTACKYNNNLDVIKYLTKDYHNNYTILSFVSAYLGFGDGRLLTAELESYYHIKNSKGTDALTLGQQNKNPEIIKYLTEWFCYYV